MYRELHNVELKRSECCKMYRSAYKELQNTDKIKFHAENVEIT